MSPFICGLSLYWPYIGPIYSLHLTLYQAILALLDLAGRPELEKEGERSVYPCISLEEQCLGSDVILFEI